MALPLSRPAKTQTQRVSLTLIRTTITAIGLSFLIAAFSLYLFDISLLSRVQLLFIAATLPAIITPFVSWQHAKRSVLIEDMQEEIRLASRQDDATGLLSRRFFYESTHRELQLASRHAYPVSLLLLRIENMNSIYKNFGRVMTGHALRSCANLLKTALRETDILARFSEDSFVILMPHSNAKQAEEVTKRLQQKLSETPIKFKDDQLKLKLLAGLSSSTEHFEISQLVNTAEQALELAEDSRDFVALEVSLTETEGSL